MFLARFIPLFIGVLFLSGCSQIQLGSHFAKKITTEKSQGKYKVGSPYKVDGVWYRPEVDYRYSETGIASWYGPGFHGKSTANGEVFDENELTAAHKTLPLPSIVRVTNLENGRSVIARVNDRGPFKKSRIIDMSKRSAELLGFRAKGVAKVRVEVLEKESRKIAEMAKQGKDTRGTEVPMNDPRYASIDTPAKTYNASTNTYQPSDSWSQAHNQAPETIPGHTKNGAFYPDPVVQQLPVRPTNMYVQAGSFSVEDNALQYAQRLKSLGDAQVYRADVNNAIYYRVRIPVADVQQADTMLSRVLSAGHDKAIIVVDEMPR